MRKTLILLTAFILFACKSETRDKGSEDYSARPSEKKVQSPEIKQSIDRGARIYNNFCATCHLASGEGIANAFPPLNNSDWLKEKRKKSIAAVKNGLNGPIEVNGEEYNSVMTDLGLTDEEVADVMNYIFTAWDNNIEPPVTVEEVARY